MSTSVQLSVQCVCPLSLASDSHTFVLTAVLCPRSSFCVRVYDEVVRQSASDLPIFLIPLSSLFLIPLYFLVPCGKIDPWVYHRLVFPVWPSGWLASFLCAYWSTGFSVHPFIVSGNSHFCALIFPADSLLSLISIFVYTGFYLFIQYE